MGDLRVSTHESLAGPAPELAFGVEPSTRRYRLRLARYVGVAELLAEQARAADRRLRVLDAGCGKGRVPRYYRTLALGPPIDLVGLDPSPGRLAEAREHDYGPFVRGRLQSLPFATATFDGLVCEQVLEHLDADALAAALCELHRVVRPGGFAVVGSPIFTAPELWLKPLWIRVQRWQHRRPGDHGGHLQHFSLKSLGRLLSAHGFAVERAQGYRLFSLFAHGFENSKAYYEFHRRIGLRYPSLCGEVDLLCRRA
jgi:SAM-dependent methyltransferase